MTLMNNRIPVSRDRGFALVAVLALAAMLVLLVIGLLTLATSETRRKSSDQARELARANARLAVDLAVADLQRYLGPDQGISASASILAKDGETAPNQSRWTGAWSSLWQDGSAIWERDDLDGGLLDKRSAPGTPDRENRVRAWLVSGGKGVNPKSDPGPSAVTLVGPGTVGNVAVDQVKVPTMPVRGTGRNGGRLAWWVGDEGVKANVGVPNAHDGKRPVPAQAAGNGYSGLLASQAIDETVFTGASTARITKEERRKLLTNPSLALASTGSRAGFHDVSVVSKGVLANPREGRLKRDLTRWLETGADIPSLGPNSPGLSARDPIIGHQSPPRQGRARAATGGPRFGVLESWAKGAAPFDGRNVASRTPPVTTVSESSVPKDAALSNFQPVAIRATDKDGLLPILVEGTYWTSWSWHWNVLPDGAIAVGKPYQMRYHVYPRVVLWNPYNVEMTLEPSMVMIQGNGRQEFFTDGYRPLGSGRLMVRQGWIGTEGGRSENWAPVGGSFFNSEGFTDPHMGAYIFAIPRTTFSPGECLVFSADKSAEYDRPMSGSASGYALEMNTLSCHVAPDPSRNFYVTNSEINGGIDFIPTSHWREPTKADGGKGIVNQGDDCRVVWKLRGNRTGITFEEFDRLPQLGIISASLQYGAGREPRVLWDRLNKVPIEETSAKSPVLATIAPDVRTREGVRLRWHREHLSNELASGPLARTPHFQEAALANWNPRASFAFRSPWDNIAGNLPRTGTAGGPWFFGVYTRDLYDQDVSWYAQMPISKNGRQLGNPFGPPQEGTGRYIVFDVPRKETGLLSIGQMMHARTSEFVWHPSFAIGQSLPDPRLGRGSLDRTAPKPLDFAEARQGGFTPDAIGWSSDAQRGGSRGSWADQAKLIFQGLPDESNLVYDLSYELNHSLWDDFFLSTGNRQRFDAWLGDPENFPLPNGRFRQSPWTPAASPDKLADFHRAAYHLMIDGAFNVNSTSVEAWKALLGSTRHLGFGPKGAAVFPRFLAPAGGPLDGSMSIDEDTLWSGYRALTEAEVDRLAREIVKQVKLRGPFLSLADFVNRRLANDETGNLGPLQAAIDAAGLNKPIEEAYPLDNSKPLPNYTHPDNIADATRLDQTLKPASTVWGAPGHLTQGDILQTIGPVLAARSDTFTIRGYGDTTDPNGRILSRAWCEAVVQRIPEPIEPDPTGLNSARNGTSGDPGRRFVIVSFRWLDAEEV